MNFAEVTFDSTCAALNGKCNYNPLQSILGFISNADKTVLTMQKTSFVKVKPEICKIK